MTTTPQRPLGSGLGPSTTADEAVAGVDLTGRTALVTGGASGLGVETVRALRAAGADVVVPARDPARAAGALDGIDGVDVRPMDLADPASVDAFADTFLAEGRPLHMLVNSAGIMAVPLGRDAAGHEAHFATNHLGHFRLTLRLWPALLGAGGARVVSVSSWGHRRADIDWDDVDFTARPYEPLDAYGQSKTANVLFAVELDRRGRDEGIRGFAVHPGSIITPLGRHTDPANLRRMGVIDENGDPVIDPSRNMKTPEQGAATAVWCAASPQLDGLGGVYCENCDVAPLVPEGAEQAQGPGPAFGVMPYAVDPAAARRLWGLSERLTGVSVD
ncbi:oxidoreductase [Streptomyces avicenniae]|uniref:oxidoreductase n=1 Tax=Streptomyces avicenniae TaxID=500153 RepID=UPI000699967D|nr:oxidoreductase [Streptomyces avicenniae]